MRGKPAAVVDAARAELEGVMTDLRAAIAASGHLTRSIESRRAA
ncbi:MAG: hypothetical protein AVDCRST_MAG85-1928 [uncultured Solirubrobacteraceae bacterium]|uniref:Uncharacterized protein n=1 Tax=uncultured Solirubrobacteraceae bacterium TaxID=1162706 RepID=A0A6J4SS36_9ACTN|nr:MAG: hypothetical protein AVDCRST_MAG85-1928 [uncultured Solirubrobacteraceae bacterium]